MRMGLDVSQHQLTWEELLARVRFGEDAGFGGVWIFDHFKPLYGDPGGPCLEAWTLLSAIAAHTSRVRMGALVTGVTYRHPSVLAAEALTVDHVSNGRLEIGIGAAWFEQEHRELGIPFPPAPERVDRLEEAVQVIDALLTRDEATVAGRHYSLANARLAPRPVQRPRPPIWIGAAGRRTMRIAARHADAWHAFGSVEDLAEKYAFVSRETERAGRDPHAITCATNLSLSEPWDEVRATAEGLAKAGFGYLVVSWPSEGKARLDEFVERVMPDVTAL